MSHYNLSQTYNKKGEIIKFILSIFFLSVIFTTLYASDIAKLTSKLNLYAGTKAGVQWERIFSSERRMQKYDLDKLSKEQRDKLKKYLIEHAADSEQPMVPGL